MSPDLCTAHQCAGLQVAPLKTGNGSGSLSSSGASWVFLECCMSDHSCSSHPVNIRHLFHLLALAVQPSGALCVLVPRCGQGSAKQLAALQSLLWEYTQTKLTQQPTASCTVCNMLACKLSHGLQATKGLLECARNTLLLQAL